MKINPSIRITFEENDIKELVKKELEEQGYEVHEVKVNVKSEQVCSGYGTMEHYTTVTKFEGVEAKVTKKE